MEIRTSRMGNRGERETFQCNHVKKMFDVHEYHF